MARIQNPIIGRAKGQAGGMVFTTLNGANVMKAKPNSYRDANTLIQQGNRVLHTDIVKMAASIKASARGLFEKQPADMPAFSKLVQQLAGAVDRSGAQPVFNPAGIEIGSGSVILANQNFVYTPNNGIVAATWDASSLTVDSDLAQSPSLLAIDKSSKKVYLITTGANCFSDESEEFTLPSGLVANNLHYCIVNSAKLSSGADLVKNVK